MEKQQGRGLWKKIRILLMGLMLMKGLEISWMPSSLYAVPTLNGVYFVNDRLTDTPGIRNNFLSTGISFNLYDHLFIKNRLGVSLHLPWTDQSRGDQVTKAFAPRGVIDVTGKDFTLNTAYGIVKNVDPVAGERTSRNTSLGMTMTPDKFLPIRFNYSENKALADPVTSTNKNWSMTTDLELEPLRLNAGLRQQESGTDKEGLISESEGAFMGADATFYPWRGTFLNAAYDLSENQARSRGNKSDTESDSLSFLVNSDLYSWLNLSGSYILDSNEGDTSTGSSSQTLSSEQELSDITVRIRPAEGWSLGLHKGQRKSKESGIVRKSDLTSYSLSIAKDVTQNVDGSFSISRSVNDDSDQGKSIINTSTITANVIVGPAMTLRVNTSVSHREIFEEAEPIPSGPGDYTAATNVNLWSSITAKTTLSVNYTASGTNDRLVFFDKESQNLGGTLSYIPKPNVVYNFSAFRSFPEQGESTSSVNGSLSYSFHKGSRINLSYQKSKGGAQISDSFSSNMILIFPKQVSLLINYNISGLSQDEKTKSLGVQFSKPF